jgi:hypothetical protein
MGLPIGTVIDASEIPQRGSDAGMQEAAAIINGLEPGKGYVWPFEGNDDMDATEVARSFAGRLRMKYPRKKYSGFVTISQREHKVYVERLDGIVDVS